MKKQIHITFFSIKIIKNIFLYIYLVLGLSLYSQSQIISKIDSAMGCIGDTLNIAVNVTNFINVTSFATAITYDPAVLTYINVQNVNTNLLNGNLLVFPTGLEILSSYINPVGSATLPNGILYELVFIYQGGSCCLHGSGDYGGYYTVWIDGCVSPLQLLSITGKVTYDDALSPHQPITNTLLKLYNSSGTLVDSTFTN